MASVQPVARPEAFARILRPSNPPKRSLTTREAVEAPQNTYARFVKAFL